MIKEIVDIRKCEVCGQTRQVYLVSVPGVPISCVYCKECFQANAHPYGILVVNTALCHGLDNCIEEWQQMVYDTCKHLNKTIEQFNQDVELQEKDILDWQEEVKCQH